MQKNEPIRVEITDINNLGYGVGHLQNGMTVFIHGAVTGEVIDARVIKVAKTYAVAKPEKYLNFSTRRQENDLCQFPKGCGGCAYRHITYEYELNLKHGYVKNAFAKAGLSHVTVNPVQSAGVLTGYRNKAQYPIAMGKDGKVQAGFYANLTHRIIPAWDCALQPPVFGKLLRFFCNFADRYQISRYNEQTGKGLLRHLYLRIAPKTGEILFCPVINGSQLPHSRELVEELKKEFPAVVSTVVNENRENTNVVLGDVYHLLAGREWIEDELCGLNFRITPASFYQVNHDACELLYGLAEKEADLNGSETVLDLYCGIGTIGLTMADRAESVLGMEIVESAVQCANENAKRNGIANATFACGDAGDPTGLLKKAKELKGNLHNTVVILDPPRKGTTKELIQAIAEAGVKKTVYVSCNPDTLARDCAVFAAYGYQIGTVTPVDLFPRTGHVESVVLISRS